MDNLFIIRSPLQLLGAKEAIHSFNLTNNIIIIIDTKGELNTKQLDLLLDEKEWKAIIRLKPNGKSNFFKYVKLIKNLKKVKYNYLFSGDYGSIHQVMISNLNAKKICLLDDGTSTIRIYDEVKFKKKNLKKEFKRKIRFLLFGLKIKDNKAVDFFTIFNLEPFRDSKVIRHDFESLKNKYKLNEKNIKKEVYIIGQAFVKYNWLDEKVYLDYIAYIMNLYNSHKIKYLLHRDENSSYLKKAFPNLELVSNNVPAEIMFINMEIKPEYVVSMFSTLLITLNSIFSDINIESYKCNKFKVNNETIENLYKYLEKNNIKVKELK